MKIVKISKINEYVTIFKNHFKEEPEELKIGDFEIVLQKEIKFYNESEIVIGTKTLKCEIKDHKYYNLDIKEELELLDVKFREIVVGSQE